MEHNSSGKADGAQRGRCKIFIAGPRDCVRTGNQMWQDYQEIRRAACKRCGSKHWGVNNGMFGNFTVTEFRRMESNPNPVSLPYYRELRIVTIPHCYVIIGNKVEITHVRSRVGAWEGSWMLQFAMLGVILDNWRVWRCQCL